MTPVEIRWKDFGANVRDLINQNKRRAGDALDVLEGLLFRGQSDESWRLESTLERYTTHPVCVTSYDRAVTAMGTLLKSLDPEVPNFCDTPAKGYDPDFVEFRNLPNCELAVYLRHHGFPSPLLDWSQSPYVAAFFAFHDPPKNASKVSVTVYEKPRMKSGVVGVGVHEVGPFLSAGRRHSFQQACYTFCTTVKDDVCQFSSHVGEKTFKSQTIVMPIDDKRDALAELASMNITEFSMFGTTDTLIRTKMTLLERIGLLMPSGKTPSGAFR